MMNTRILDTVVFLLFFVKRVLLSTKRKFNELCRNLDYRLHHILARADVTILIRVRLDGLHLIGLIVDSILLFHIKK